MASMQQEKTDEGRLKLFQIAVEGNTGSTGTIAESIGRMAIEKGWDSYIAYGRFPRPSLSETIKIGNDLDIILHGIETRLFDRHCLGSRRATKELVSRIDEIKPDIVQLHHLHGYYINIEILFSYLEKANIPVVWIFHDCWSFTGHCAYFDFVGCIKWKEECNFCPQRNEYPASWFIDRSRGNYHLKKRLFNSLNNLFIVTVSEWLSRLVRESFFANRSVTTIHNGIDINVFKPSGNGEEIRRKHSLQNRFIIIGVASPWTKRKGLSEFVKLSEYLGEDEIILLVGLSRSEIRKMPGNIIGLTRTENRQKLAELYSASDVFVNPTLEDNFPTTNIESLACGTPVITYKTGGCSEALNEETGIVVERGSITGLLDAISIVRRNGKEKYMVTCRERAERYFSGERNFLQYLKLYSEILKNKPK